MNNTIDVTFQLPPWVRRGLESGKLERIGGIIRDIDSKAVKLWLRETSALPSNLTILPPYDRQLLGMANGIMSAMSFGFNQIAGRLDGIEDALWEMNERLYIIEQQIGFLYKEVKQVKDIIIQGFNMVFDRLQNLEWTIDVGFQNIQAGLEYYNQKQLEHIEREYIARLNHAANLAMETQYLEPNSQARILRIETALNEAGKVSSLLWEYTNSKVTDVASILSQKPKDDFSVDKNVLQSLYLLRQNCFASNLKASLLAETSISSARDHLLQKSRELSDLYSQFKVLDRLIPLDEMSRFFKIEGIEKFIGGGYSYVHKKDLENLTRIPKDVNLQLLPDNSSPNVKVKVSRFDENKINVEIPAGVNRGNHKLSVCPVQAEDLFKLKSLPLPTGFKSNENTKEYFDLMGGIGEDIERISAYPLELEEAIRLNLNICEYRELLKVPYTKEGKLAFVSLHQKEKEGN
ncbi:MAG: hypothetical protein H7A23_01470 [Leptospiraceae bacterium]|nr:hypothetical protein [Leptospiraceae bacterium]